MTEEQTPSSDKWVDPEEAILHQDTFRKVLMGEVADPLYPPHPAPPEAAEDELTQAAMEDPGVAELQEPHPQPTLWRLVTLIAFAVIALTIVFWRFR